MKKVGILFAMLLTGCGFHPPQQGPVNPTLRLMEYHCGNVRAPLCGLLANRLTAIGYTLVPKAPYRLQLHSLQMTSVSSPVGATVNRQYYDVNAQLTYTIISKHLESNAEQTLYAHKLALTNANQLEGSQRQLQQVYADLLQDLLDLLQIRIAHYEDTTRTTERITPVRTPAAAAHQR